MYTKCSVKCLAYAILLINEVQNADFYLLSLSTIYIISRPILQTIS